MRQKNFGRKIWAALLTGAMLLLAEPGMRAEASQATYTVTYRAGNVGCFAVTGTEKTEKKAMAEEVAKLLYAGNEEVTQIQVTENGAIRLTVNKGAAVPVAPAAGYVQTEAGYFVRNASQWGAEADEAVIKNVDYVVDYGKLVDGVEYTVKYVDAVSGTQVAPVAVAYGNVGDTVEITAPATVTVSGAAGYYLQGAARQGLILSRNSAENVLTFTYGAEPATVEVNEITEYEEGDTVVVTQTVNVPAQGGTGAVLAPNQQETPNEPDDEIANIDEEDVPLQGGIDEDSEEGATENSRDRDSDSYEDVVVIEEEQTALSSFFEEGGNKGIYLGVGLAAALLIAVGAVWLQYNRHAGPADGSNTEDKTK